MKIVLSTNNSSKAEQIKAVFAGSSISILTLADAGIEGGGIEDGTSLEENALKKAMFVHEACPSVWSMSDDTGIFINALGGAPGVHTADWSGGNKETKQFTKWILKQLENISDRSATFKTVVAVVTPEGKQHFFTGEVRGKILRMPRVKPQPKMPYSSIFVPDETDKVWAEMTVEEENKISHRGKAFRQARQFLETLQ
jgi:XTP/dITP diphosphohydrolase